MVISILLDSCALWPPQIEEKIAISKLFDLEQEDKIDNMEIAQPTEEEISNIKTMPIELQNRIYSRIKYFSMANTFEEIKRIKEIETLLFPSKPTLKPSDKRDAMILFTAFKYMMSHLVTVNTNHLIKNGMDTKIYNKFRIKAILPSECLEEVLKYLKWTEEHKEKMKELKLRQNNKII